MRTSGKVEKLLASKLTSYKIAKDNGFTVQYIDSLRLDKTVPNLKKIEGMGLAKAEKLADYYDANVAKGNIRSLGKQQWLNLACLSKNAEEAKEFFAHNVYGWLSKESAFNSFRHAMKQGAITRLSLQDLPTSKGNGEPEDYVEWLSELSSDDLVER